MKPESQKTCQMIKREYDGDVGGVPVAVRVLPER